MTISLPAPLRRYIEGRTKYQYGSVSEYIRELVRQDDHIRGRRGLVRKTNAIRLRMAAG